MPDQIFALFDPAALAIVLAGTLLATIARSGWHHMRIAARMLGMLFAPGFDEAANRAALARIIPELRRKGHLCAEISLPPDREIAQLVTAYQASGSLDAFSHHARAQRTAREVVRIEAERVFEHAGDLAPVFGLVGTLYSITRLVPVEGVGAAEITMASVATAVLSSLYGVLTAHFLCVPAARAIERRGARDEVARAALLDWFEAEIDHPEPRKRERAQVRDLRDAA